MSVVLDSSATHHLVLGGILEQVGLTQPDLCIISKDGLPLFTNKILLGVHSKFIKKIFSDVPAPDYGPAYLHLPVSSRIVLSLIRLLSHGVTKGDEKLDLLEVVEAAETLGVDLEALQINDLESKGNNSIRFCPITAH